MLNMISVDHLFCGIDDAKHIRLFVYEVCKQKSASMLEWLVQDIKDDFCR